MQVEVFDASYQNDALQVEIEGIAMLRVMAENNVFLRETLAFFDRGIRLLGYQSESH